MPTYKLIYFNLRARAEVIRFIFAVAKQPYIDERIRYEDWPAMKAKTPFGQLPLLEVDGEILCQSFAISVYLATQFGLAGETPWEHARILMIGQCVEDAFRPLVALMSEKNPEKQAEIRKNYAEKQLPVFLSKLENFLSSNGDGNGYIVGNKLSVADLALLNFFYEPKDLFGVDVDLDKYPKLKDFKSRIENEPGLAEWLKTRPPYS